MIKKYFYTANWKMYWTFNEALEFTTRYYDNFIELGRNPENTIILCPSSTVLYPISQMFQNTSISIGSQDCSDHRKGAFTGQLSAEDLSAAGATLCIIGHSERRQCNGETDAIISKKFESLIEQRMSPILCIGETDEQHRQERTLNVLEGQLQAIFEYLKPREAQVSTTPLFIAYEPIWAIGTGKIPTPEHVRSVFTWLVQEVNKHTSLLQWNLLYGGSVSSANAQQFYEIENVDGFLIGGSSLNFQEFEKIIKSRINCSL